MALVKGSRLASCRALGIVPESDAPEGIMPKPQTVRVLINLGQQNQPMVDMHGRWISATAITMHCRDDMTTGSSTSSTGS